MGYDVLRTVSSNLVKSSLILEKRMPQSLRTGSYVPYFRFDHFRVKETIRPPMESRATTL